MTRGRHPDRALEKSEKIAKGRGLVHYYERGPGLLADFSITTRELKTEVKIKRLRRIRTTPAGLEREAAEEIAGLRIFPSSAEISRELWIYSPDYFWRFFRVTQNGLVELARDGSVLQPKAPAGTFAALIPAIAVGSPAPVAVQPEPQGAAVLPSNSPVPAPTETFVGEAVSPSETDPPEGCTVPEDPVL
jgi:hypothetical protein